jgi:hypothetical protein
VAVGALVCAVVWSTSAQAQSASVHIENPSGESDVGTDKPSQGTTDDGDTRAFRLGALVGVGFPRPLAIEGIVKLGRWVALGVEYSAMPSMNILGVDTAFWGVAGDVRFFPMRNGFFIGMRGGFQHLAATATMSAMSITVTESATAETAFLNPRIGFLHTWKSGLTLGIDAGVQLPLTPKLVTTVPSGIVPQVDATLVTVSSVLGNNVTPTIDLIRLGFLL